MSLLIPLVYQFDDALFYFYVLVLDGVFLLPGTSNRRELFVKKPGVFL